MVPLPRSQHTCRGVCLQCQSPSLFFLSYLQFASFRCRSAQRSEAQQLINPCDSSSSSPSCRMRSKRSFKAASNTLWTSQPLVCKPLPSQRRTKPQSRPDRQQVPVGRYDADAVRCCPVERVTSHSMTSHPTHQPTHPRARRMVCLDGHAPMLRNVCVL